MVVKCQNSPASAVHPHTHVIKSIIDRKLGNLIIVHIDQAVCILPGAFKRIQITQICLFPLFQFRVIPCDRFAVYLIHLR